MYDMCEYAAYAVCRRKKKQIKPLYDTKHTA